MSLPIFGAPKPALPHLPQEPFLALAWRNSLLPGGGGGKRDPRILQPVPLPPPDPTPTLQKKFLQPPSVQSSPPPITVHSCLAPSSPWFTAGLGLQPADLRADQSPELTLVLGTSRPLPGPSSSRGPVLSLVRLPWCPSREPWWGQGGLSAPVLPALLALPRAVCGHHFPLLLQSLGVKCRHLESMRSSRLSIARSCPSTMSSDSVRIYWPL